MYGIAFEWDRRKDSANRRKHNIGFAEASTVFDDPLSITIPDPDHGEEEERYLIIGMSSTQSLLVVIHTVRGERIRLISARSATRHEKDAYQEDPR
jgi:uncharacterized protein